MINFWRREDEDKRILVRDDPKLPEDVGGSIPNYEVSSLLDKNLARWSTASRALALICRPSI